MATAFLPVNSPAPMPEVVVEEMTSPATPRPPSIPRSQPPPQEQPTRPVDEATTPTRESFSASLASQKPLPSSPFPQAVQVPEAAEKLNTPPREGSQPARKSHEPMDVDMEESDGAAEAGEEGAASDDESVNADGTRSNKKKKSQRFYCTDFPPCSLSFTRSEHLARHIRKHTGERPFQCHCSRRFSRLDNLRQHAQTVHVNEDIPMDSLAATGGRFQRQVRPDRVRPAGRARASTAGSAGGPIRGHSKSLSTSSINSLSSIGSAYSPRDDIRRRPPPLVMADGRARLSLESYRGGADGGGAYPSYRPASPSDFSTPTSATFSTGQSSPRWGSGVASPTSSHSRSHSMYLPGTRTPGRRLSVPSGGNPFQSPHGANVARPIFGPGAMNSSNSGAFTPSSSGLLSPAPSNLGWPARRDSMAQAADEAWRRRTWHPDTRNNFNGGGPNNMATVMAPGQFPSSPAPAPLANPQAKPQHTVRLPGIESFDPIPRPASPPHRNPSPMMIDTEMGRPPATIQPPVGPASEERRNPAQWDMGLHRGLTRLDITSKNTTPPRDSAGAWANEAERAVQAQAEQVRLNPPTVRFEAEPVPTFASQNAGLATRVLHQHTLSAPSIATPRESKRHGWYHGPAAGNAANNPAEHEQAADPRTARVERMVHPNVAAFSGFPQRETQPQPHQQPPPPNNADPLRRLEALVAVATSEGSTATAY